MTIKTLRRRFFSLAGWITRSRRWISCILPGAPALRGAVSPPKSDCEPFHFQPDGARQPLTRQPIQSRPPLTRSPVREFLSQYSYPDSFALHSH